MKFIEFMKKFYIYILIFIVGLGFRAYALSTQPALHIDEPCSFAGTSTSNELDKGVRFKRKWDDFNLTYGKEYKAGDIRKTLFIGEKTVPSVLKDLNTLREDNFDRQHPTLYYSVLRIWNLGLGDFDFHKYIDYARSLNILFYVISFFFMFRLLSLIKDDKKFISLGLFFTAVNGGSIMLCTMAREYSLMEMLYIITTFIAFDISRKIIDNKNISTKMLFIYPIGLSLFLLSGYYAIVYAGIIIFLLILLSIYYKRWENLIKILNILMITIIYTTLLYPDYFNFSCNNEHYDSVKGNFFNTLRMDIELKLESFTDHLNRYLYGKFFAVIIYIVSLNFIIPDLKICEDKNFNKKELSTLAVIILCTMIWGILVSLTVVYSYYSRYILPASAIYCLLLVLFMYRFKPLHTYTIIFLVCLFNIIAIANGDLIDKDRLSYHSKLEPVAINTPVPKDIPVVFVEPYSYVVGQVLFGNIPPENTVRFEKTFSKKAIIYKKFTLICPQNSLNNIKKQVKKVTPLLYIRNDRAIYSVED